MIDPPNENDKRQAKSNYLHFEDEDVSTCDIYFDTFDEAVNFVNDREWSFGSEDWEPAGLFEAKISCVDMYGTTVGHLLKLTIKLTEE